VLAKIEPAALSMRRLLSLRRAFSDPATADLLSHLPHIGRSALTLVGEHRLRRHASTQLLLDLVEHETRRSTATTAEDDIVELVRTTCRMAALVGIRRWPRPFGRWPTCRISVASFRTAAHEATCTHWLQFTALRGATQ
jgi:hypothetical protein